MLVDTHCHIHEPTYQLPIDDVIARAAQAGVGQYICVGTSEESSEQAVAFAEQYAESGAYAAVGVHPHDSKDGYGRIAQLATTSKIVAIGEIGLDYSYTHSSRTVQLEALNAQLEVAQRHELPVIFHVREAFADFWPVFEAFPGLRGVLHSYTDSSANLERALGHGLRIGVNGISTFCKDEAQRALFDTIPLEALMFETDAPFLTPTPHRGKVNEPAYVRLVAEYHAQRRGLSLEEVATTTTQTARALFALS